ncbi:MAG: aminoacyl-tRNA hydrolase [Clostridiales Family XIII bacterium]|jgi:PTH1 family peptidyl-tRNA hydrolase|nr:aminoacyl-tRNA hydrolase [Clostridiales Family XIII bacterium]
MLFRKENKRTFIIVGLGNPGAKYEKTRHNAGFCVIDRLAEKLGVTNWKSKHKALLGETKVKNIKVFLVKPQTYMNASGDSVISLLRYHNVDPGDLVVIYDDIDIPMGKVRIRKEGSAGSHNGMRSIVGRIGGAFLRVRIGIGADRGEISLIDFVLGRFTSAEQSEMADVYERAANAVLSILEDGVDTAMNRYNG